MFEAGTPEIHLRQLADQTRRAVENRRRTAQRGERELRTRRFRRGPID